MKIPNFLLQIALFSPLNLLDPQEKIAGISSQFNTILKFFLQKLVLNIGKK
jgi:hypothetical protein